MAVTDSTTNIAALAELYLTVDELTATVAQLRVALASRDVIGQAKGILMYRDEMTAAEAFAVLVTTSQDTNRKLRDVAVDVIADLG